MSTVEDSEVISLFSMFLSVEIGLKNSLSVPQLVHRIVELSPDLKSSNLMF